MKTMLKSQLKKTGLPEAQQDMIMGAVLEHPELFEKIAKEIQHEMKQGKNQTQASMEVMKKHQAELQAIMQKK
jgi:hypothetical protein